MSCETHQRRWRCVPKPLKIPAAAWQMQHECYSSMYSTLRVAALRWPCKLASCGRLAEHRRNVALNRHRAPQLSTAGLARSPLKEKSTDSDVLSVFWASKPPRWGCIGSDGIWSSVRAKGKRLPRVGSCCDADAPLAVTGAVHTRRDETAQDLRTLQVEEG